MRKISALILCMLLTFLTACGTAPAKSPSGQASNSDSKDVVTLRVGNIYTQDTTYGKALDKLKQDVEKASNGKLKLDIFHNSQLGSEKDHIEAIRSGSLEMMETGTAGIGLYVPETAIFELWYNYKDLNSLVKAFDVLTPELDKMYQEKGFKLLGAYFDGPRDILSKKKIETIDDLKGLKFRVPGSKLYVNMANALGSKGTSIALGEVYTSLQTGVIDAMEGTPDSILQAKYYEQAKYLIDDRHVFQPLSIIIGKDAWDKLSEQNKKILSDAVKENSKYHLSLVQKANDDAIQALKAKGVEVVEPKDSDKWKAAVSQANADYAKQYGDKGKMILDKINESIK